MFQAHPNAVAAAYYAAMPRRFFISLRHLPPNHAYECHAVCRRSFLPEYFRYACRARKRSVTRALMPFHAAFDVGFACFIHAARHDAIAILLMPLTFFCHSC